MRQVSRLHFLIATLPFAASTLCNGPATLYCQEPAVQHRLEEGDRLFEAGLTTQAISSYKLVIDSLEAANPSDEHSSQLLLQARFNLSQILMSDDKTAAAAELLKNNVDTTLPPSGSAEMVRRRSLFHLALAQKRLKDYPKAKESLAAYLRLPPPLPENDEAAFESGLVDYLMGNPSSAKKIFESLADGQAKPQLRTLAGLYLARILLAEKKEKEAENILNQLAKQVKREDPLYHEIAFMQGETAFRLHDYDRAIQYYKDSLPSTHSKLCNWYGTAHYMQGLCRMRLAELPGKSREELSSCYEHAEEAFRKMTDSSPNEEGYLALAQCYLARVGRLKENSYYSKAEELLSQEALFTSEEGKTHALLLRAEAAPTYAIRDKYYRQLTKNGDADSPLYAKAWYMRGLNDFEHGSALVKKGDRTEGSRFLEEAAVAFRKTFELTKNRHLRQAGEALKLQAVALGYNDKQEGSKKAVAVLSELIHDNPDVWKRMKSPNEALYLHGYYTGRLATGPDKERYLASAASSLLEAASHQNDKFAEQALRHLGNLYFVSEAYGDAEQTYLRLADTFPESPYATEALVWSARCAELLGKDQVVAKERRKRAVELGDSRSAFGAEAYFALYTYRDYLQGDRTAVRHLQGFASRYPESPFLIEAHYLIGLDNKRDRKSEEGRWIRKKSMTDAIDAFQKAELLFDDLATKKLIPREKLNYYAAMRYRATFERAMANLSIANDAHAAKRQIYLDYAEEVFENLLADLNDGKNPHIKLLLQAEPQLSLREECSFWLAQTYIKGEKESEAEQILKGMADSYAKNGIVKSYYLSRTLSEQGRMAMRRNDFPGAMRLLKAAEEAGKGGVLGTDQRLDLSIQQSLCCRSLGQYDDAILILSKVINDDAISSLRVKAMYLRAETYELQGRPELAKKQLESMVKKGGAWAKKAQEKLERDYLSHGK